METGATPVLRASGPRKPCSVRLSVGTRLGAVGFLKTFRSFRTLLKTLRTRLGACGAWLGPIRPLRT